MSRQANRFVFLCTVNSILEVSTLQSLHERRNTPTKRPFVKETQPFFGLKLIYPRQISFSRQTMDANKDPNEAMDQRTLTHVLIPSLEHSLFPPNHCFLNRRLAPLALPDLKSLFEIIRNSTSTRNSQKNASAKLNTLSVKSPDGFAWSQSLFSRPLRRPPTPVHLPQSPDTCKTRATHLSPLSELVRETILAKQSMMIGHPGTIFLFDTTRTVKLSITHHFQCFCSLPAWSGFVKSAWCLAAIFLSSSSSGASPSCFLILLNHCVEVPSRKLSTGIPWQVPTFSLGYMSR